MVSGQQHAPAALYPRELVAKINPLTPNETYRGRTAQLTFKRCILYIYSTNRRTEYFKHGIYSPFFPLQNAVCFIILTYLVPVILTFHIQDVLKLKKIIPAPKGKHGVYSPFFPSSNCCLFRYSNVFGSFTIHILYTECAKIIKNNSGA